MQHMEIQREKPEKVGYPKEAISDQLRDRGQKKVAKKKRGEKGRGKGWGGKRKASRTGRENAAST